MGIPAFYRFLVERYPNSVVDVVEEVPALKDVDRRIDLCGANPNGVEFDNLYLDMNAIIHPCFHPEGLPPPKTYDGVFNAVFQYVDRIFAVIRPRKLLFMAVDGVAPRAKMNQQRARRFRAAKDAVDEISGRGYLSPLEQTDTLDSNVITPGTEFMSLLSSALQYYIAHRMNMDSGWQGIKVILSDASVPGEGEHKIISYVRLQRNLPEFDPNTRHCLYGLDADLIMLALATHELYFSVLREDVRNAQSDHNWKCSHREAVDNSVTDFIRRQKFQFLHVWILREYLAHELRIPDAEVKPNLEGLIDDFVFMCMFVGNDFLPHVPSLEISEGAIDLLMSVYKKEFVQMGGYLTNGFEVNLERVQHFIQAVGAHENIILYKRSQVQKGRKLLFGHSCTNRKVKGRKRSLSTDAKSLIDKVRLGEEGFKERYYAEKFGAGTEEDLEIVRKQAVQKYIEGICWVMHYYYQGVCSWQWFYPYHYAPFASDFYDLNQLKVQFKLGKPFKPYSQLMAVLPAASAHALPLFYRNLMTDPSSPIFDFYPTDFELDMNGKQRSWQAVCKLPFIEESRLLLETAKVEHTLTDDERRRNRLGMDILFVHELHSLATKIILFVERNNGHRKLTCGKVKRKINPKASGGMNGYLYISEKPVWPVEIPSPITGMELITGNKVLSVYYKCPSSHPHILKLPDGVRMPKMSISKRHIQPPPVLWHEMSEKLGHADLKRHIPNCVFGPCLAKFAHRLVTQQYPPARRLERQEGCLNGSEVGAVNLDDNKCSPEDANESVSADLQNPVNGSHHVEPKKKRKKIREKSQGTNEKSGAVTGVVNLDDKKCSPEDANESVSAGLQNPVNGSHHVEPKKKRKRIGKKSQATNEKSAAAAVTGVVNLDDTKCKPEDANESVYTDLQNPVNGSHLVEPNNSMKISKRSQATNEKSAAAVTEKCDDPAKRRQEVGAVNLDDNKCSPEDANESVSADLQNPVNGSHHVEPKKKRKKIREKSQGTNEKSGAVTGVVNLYDKKCSPEDANESASAGLQNPVNGSHHVEPKKKRKRIGKKSQATNEKSAAAAVTGVVSLDDTKCKPEDANESVYTDLQNPVNGSHLVEHNNSMKISKRSQATNEKSAAAVTEKCDDPAKRRQKNVEPSQASESSVLILNEVISSGLLNGVNGNQHDESVKNRRMKINLVNDNCDEAVPVENIQKKVEPNQVKDREVSVDNEKCKPKVDEPVSTGLLNMVNESHHDEPKNRSGKKRRRIPANKNSYDADSVKPRQEIVELNQVSGKCNEVEAVPVENIQKEVGPNQVKESEVSVDNEKCKPKVDEPVSTGLLNMVNESHHDEFKKKKRRKIRANTKSNDAAVTGECNDADSVKPRQEIVEPNQLSGKCDEVEAVPVENIQKEVEPNQVKESEVSVDNEKCKPKVDKPVSTGLLNMVNESHHDERKKKKRRRIPANKKSNDAAVTGDCNEADSVKPRQEIVELNQVSGKCDEVEAVPVENIQKEVEPNQVKESEVSVDNEKCKPKMDEPVSTGLLNMVKEGHPDESKKKKRRKIRANTKSNDAAVTGECNVADSVKPRQEIVELNQLSGKCDEVEAVPVENIQKEVEPNQVKESEVSVDNEKCKPKVDERLLNMVNESHHDELKKKKRRRIPANKKSNDAAVTGDCNEADSVKPRQEIVELNQVSGKCDEVEAVPVENSQKEVEPNQVKDSEVSVDNEKCKPKVDEPVSTGLLNMVNEGHHDESKKKKRRKIRANTKSNDAAVTGECNDADSVKPRQEIVEPPHQVSGKCDEVEADPVENIQKKVEPNQVKDSEVSVDNEKCKPKVDELVSTGLLNMVNESHHEEPKKGSGKKSRRIQANKKSLVAAVTGECNEADSVTPRQEIVEPPHQVSGKCDEVEADPVENIQKKVEPNQVKDSEVSVDNETCNPKVDEPVSTALLKMVNESHHDEPKKKKRRRIPANKKSNDAAVTGECNDADSMKPRPEIVELNQVSGKSNEVEADLVENIQKKVEPNQVKDSEVSLDNEKCKAKVVELVSTGLLNMVNESNLDESEKGSGKKRRRIRANKKSLDAAVTGECNEADSVKPRQEIVEPNQVSGKCNDVEAEQDDIVIKKKGKRKRNFIAPESINVCPNEIHRELNNLDSEKGGDLEEGKKRTKT